MENKLKVAVIMGSDSDFEVMKKAVLRLKAWNIPVEAHVMSAHRTPAAAAEFSAYIKKRAGIIPSAF